MIRIKRVYDPVEPDDGARFLVERLWPRGIKKDARDVEHNSALILKSVLEEQLSTKKGRQR